MGHYEYAPQVVRDYDGDTWERQSDGSYRCEFNGVTLANFERLSTAFGPLTELALA